MMDRLEQLSGTKMFIGKPDGKFYDKTFDDVDLKDLDWLNGQEWLPRKHLKIAKALIEYLNHPVIKKELESELGY